MAMIEVTCPCGKHFGVTDQAGGLTADCPACGKELDVPDVDAFVPLTTIEDDDEGELTVAIHPIEAPTVELDENIALEALSGGRRLSQRFNAISAPDVSFVHDVLRSGRILLTGANLMMTPTLAVIDFMSMLVLYLAIYWHPVFAVALLTPLCWHWAICLKVCRSAVAGETHRRIAVIEDDLWEDLIKPMGRLFASVWASTMPLWGYWLICRVAGISPPSEVDWALVGLCAFLWPATVLLLAVGESVTALTPPMILRLCTLAIGPYLAVWFAIASILVCCIMLVQQLAVAFDDTRIGVLAAIYVPLLVLSVSSLIVMRTIGLMYHHYKAKLPFEAE